jgi:hypothetical protein
MKSVRTLLLSGFLLGAAWPASGQQDPVDYYQCLVKTSTVYGTECAQCPVTANTMRIYLTNQCEVALEVKLAMKDPTRRVRVFTAQSLAPRDSLSGYICEGNARFYYWARKVGDQSIEMPSDQEIIDYYSKND